MADAPPPPPDPISELQDAVEQAFAHVGGVAYLVQFARDEPRAFAALLAKVLPVQKSGEQSAPKQIEVKRVIIRPDNPDR